MTLGEATRLLGVPADASEAEIRDAFRSVVKASHPDRSGGAIDVGRYVMAKDALLLAAGGSHVRAWKAPPLEVDAGLGSGAASGLNPRRRADAQSRRLDRSRTTRAIIDRRVLGDRRRTTRPGPDRRLRAGRRPADDIRARRRELIAAHGRRAAAAKQAALVDDALHLLASVRDQMFT